MSDKILSKTLNLNINRFLSQTSSLPLYLFQYAIPQCAVQFSRLETTSRFIPFPLPSLEFFLHTFFLSDKSSLLTSIPSLLMMSWSVRCVIRVDFPELTHLPSNGWTRTAIPVLSVLNVSYRRPFACMRSTKRPN